MSVRTFIFRLLPAVFLLVGCTRFDGYSGLDPESPRTWVPVALSLAIAPEENGMLSTKADYEPETPGYVSASAIKTLLLLQFEWQDDDAGSARLINQQFIPDGTASKAKLVSSAHKNTVYVIANIWGKIDLPLGATQSDFLAYGNGNLLSTLDDVTGTGIWYVPDDGNRYLRMSASVYLENGVSLNTSIGTVYLKRNCAKVVIKLKNSSPDGTGKVTINKVQLRAINRKFHYVTEVSSPLSFQDPYSVENPHRFHDAEKLFPDDGVAGTGADTGYTLYTWYIPANERGTVSNAALSSQSDKNRHAPQGATYFRIYATCGGQPVVYTYFLGSNLTNNYDLEPNKKYAYTIDITRRGDAAADARIEDQSDVIFTRDANCYMLKPPTFLDGQVATERIYKIPVRRAAIFWNAPGTNMGVYSAALVQSGGDSYLLEETTTWSAWLVWNEVKDAEGNPVPDNELLVGASGTGFTSGSNRYISIKVKSGMTGNALVAIKKTSEPTMNDVLWSWHIWVTDYDPYVPMTASSGSYIYSVPNGEIHRYAGTIWSSDYASAFMMDRNLGATVTMSEEEPIETYGLLYQWGRKDPFRPSGSVAAVAADGTGAPGAGSPKQNIRYSVHNPDRYIVNTGNWTAYETSGVILGARTAAWNDLKTHSEDSENASYDRCEAGKSIYDPCPYGWQVPKDGTWADFDLATTTVWQGVSVAPGRWYYPGGINAGYGRVWYPALSHRSPQTGAVRSRSDDSSACNWSSTWLSNVEKPYNYWSIETNLKPSNQGLPTNGLSVRCIRTSYTTPY